MPRPRRSGARCGARPVWVDARRHGMRAGVDWSYSCGARRTGMPRAPNSAATSGLRADRRIRFGVLCHLRAPARIPRTTASRHGYPRCPPYEFHALPCMHVGLFPRTLTRRYARGPLPPHVNPTICTWAALPTCRSRGLRAHKGVYVQVIGPTCGTHAGQQLSTHSGAGAA